MPSSKNTFSAHILNADPEKEEGIAPPKQPPIEPVAVSKAEVPAREIRTNVVQAAEEAKIRLDYRKTRADKEGKGYINVLIDRDLQSELKPRMVTRKLTWESLVERLLRRWLEENPGYKP